MENRVGGDSRRDWEGSGEEVEGLKRLRGVVEGVEKR